MSEVIFSVFPSDYEGKEEEMSGISIMLSVWHSYAVRMRKCERQSKDKN